MPRQDVPYGGAICRLKERIAEIWDKLGEKLHSINGVEGDGQGDVKLVSGDPAVIITDDQLQHEIEISLDSSQLPAAAVSSVNGQTGAVVLDANDIDAGLTPPGTSVAQDLASTKGQLQVVGGLLQQEVLDRQNADSTLQGNINAALATIPGEVSSQIANDATIAQLVTADGQNVKLTGNQTISGVKTVPTATTGSGTQQIANGEKIQNDLANYAFMVRTVNNQTINGNKTFNHEIIKKAAAFNRCFTVQQNILSSTAPTQDKAFWPLIVANNDLSAFPVRFSVSQDTTNTIHVSIEVLHPNGNLPATLRINRSASGLATLEFNNGSTWIRIA